MLLVLVVFSVALTNSISCDYVVSSARQTELNPLSKGYNRINAYLCDHVASDNLETNMHEARRWYYDEVRHSPDRNFVKAVKLFISLDDMDKCTGDSFRVIEGNDFLASHNHPLDDSGSRVANIVNHYAKDHARKCLPKYPEILRQEYEKLGESITDRAHALTDAIIHKDEKDHGELIYEVVKKMTQKSPDGKSFGRTTNKQSGYLELNVQNVKYVYDKYVIDTCRKFVTIDDDDLLRARNFDQKWIDREETDELMSKFSDRYWTCDSIIGSDSERLYRAFALNCWRN